MSHRTTPPRGRHRKTTGILAGCLALFSLAIAAMTTEAAQPRAKEKVRTRVGSCSSKRGTLFARRGSDSAWQTLKPEGLVFSGDVLVALPGGLGEMESTNGAVRLSLAGNWPPTATPLLLESAVMVHAGKERDLDFTLERGRVRVKNLKKKGPVRIRVRFHGEQWDLTLNEPGAEVAVESLGGWRVAPRAFDKAVKGEKPESTVVLVVIQGEVDIKAGTNEYSLDAPPGPALYSWDTENGHRGPAPLKELPTWARKTKPAEDKRAKTARAAVADLRQSLAKTEPRAALVKALADKKAARRELAVYCLGAIDDLSALLDALADEDHRDVRQAAIKELRHWLACGNDHPARLYQALLYKKYKRGQAAIVMQLLFGFSPGQLARPETYALLIEYLKHGRLAIRELAHRHLLRLVPDGRSIAYDPAGSVRQRARAYAAWKKRIPDGEVPSERQEEKED
jgi:hypothetical protein